MAKKKWYIVIVGKEVGVFTTWAEVASLVSGTPGAIHQSFPTEEEARLVFERERAKGNTKRIGSGETGDRAQGAYRSASSTATWSSGVSPSLSQTRNPSQPLPRTQSPRTTPTPNVTPRRVPMHSSSETEDEEPTPSMVSRLVRSPNPRTPSRTPVPEPRGSVRGRTTTDYYSDAGSPSPVTVTRPSNPRELTPPRARATYPSPGSPRATVRSRSSVVSSSGYSTSSSSVAASPNPPTSVGLASPRMAYESPPSPYVTIRSRTRVASSPIPSISASTSSSSEAGTTQVAPPPNPLNSAGLRSPRTVYQYPASPRAVVRLRSTGLSYPNFPVPNSPSSISSAGVQGSRMLSPLNSPRLDPQGDTFLQDSSGRSLKSPSSDPSPREMNASMSPRVGLPMAAPPTRHHTSVEPVAAVTPSSSDNRGHTCLHCGRSDSYAESVSYGFSQPVHVKNVSYESGYDPRSPMTRNTPIPVPANSPTFPRPSPSINVPIEDTMSTLFLR